MLRSLLAAVLLLPLAAAAQAPDSFALPETPQRPESVALAGASVAVVTDDPLVLFDNPSMLAAAGQRPSFRVGSGVAPDFFGFGDFVVGSGAATVGLRTSLAGRPLTVGLSAGYSEIFAENGLFNPGQSNDATEERAYGGGIGLGWTARAARFRVGAAAFQRESFETRQPLSGTAVRDKAVTLDLGASFTAPHLPGPTASGETAPALSITAGYAAQNLTLSSDSFEREFPTNEGDLEVAQRGGLSVSVALVRQLGARGRFRVVEGVLSGESRRGLDETNRYAGAVTLGETLTLRAGVNDRNLLDNWISYGASLSIDGLLRAIGTASESPGLFALSDRLTARLDLARFAAGEDVQSEYAGFTLGWRP
ncbi:MAG: hypothetical protein AAFQ43_04490 [Bacteroidota bacterium]